MNREFVKKMLQAEVLKYEALKELLPAELKNRVECLEKETKSLVKDIAFSLLMADPSAEKEKSHKSTKKINVDFEEVQ